MKKVLSKFSKEELIDYIQELGEKKYKAEQIYSWIWKKSAANFDDMTDVKKEFREILKENCTILDCKIKLRQISKDGTIKYLVEFKDGELAETVLMRFDNRSNLSMCVSSQIGCKMNCRFCATGKNGFRRNLEAYEIASQILIAQQDTKLKITNVVFMGQGEPLDNFNNVIEAFKIINQHLQISTRRMTVSTAGVVPKIKALTELSAIPTLAISLHSPNHEKRLQIMPIEKKYSMSELKSALKEFNQTTKDRITIEYILIKDFNDSIKDAKELIEYLSDLKCNINIIPYNSIEENIFQKPDKKTIMKFKYLLEQSGKKVTVRLERGADIDAACGQLAGRYNS